tara:strand:+ start:1268 stop:1450 length:183 start_codon:yes stop_codon:yes gene_type:complete
LWEEYYPNLLYQKHFHLYHLHHQTHHQLHFEDYNQKERGVVHLYLHQLMLLLKKLNLILK